MKRSFFLPVIVVCWISSCKPEDVKAPAKIRAEAPDSTGACAWVKSSEQAPMVLIKSGKYIPIYGRDSDEVNVHDFMLDVYPVTNEQFREFVKHNPRWRKSKVKQLFGDDNYLRGWKNDTTPGDDQSLNAPVTSVSWYAANAYCECQGKRLPTIDEWEYAAMANETQPDARRQESFTQYILDWYERPKGPLADVGSTYKNYWGVYDLNGLVWEWTSDFNSVLMSDDSRKGSSDNLFCGGASIGASDLRNYAAFMRYSFRGSLKANYSVQNLGFRCAMDIPEKQTE